MNRSSDVKFHGSSRIHIALEVADLERSIAFYRVLFGEEPTKVRPGYAKFEPAEPSVNLALNAGVGERLPRKHGDQHFGLQVQSSDAVDALAARLRSAGLAVRAERDVECCYAAQDKAWVADPDGNPWEVFVVVRAESDRRTPIDSSCCAVPIAGAAASETCCGG